MTGADGGSRLGTQSRGILRPMALPAEQRRRRCTIDEYLRRERDSVGKNEYDDGEILAMAGATRVHVSIAGNVYFALRLRLKGKPCVPYTSDLRIRLPDRPRFVYPDVTVICGDPLADPDDPTGETYLNPRLIVEVLSPTTERYDRRDKFDRYRQVESFREYVLVAQDAARVETYYRATDGTWAFDVAAGTDAVAQIRSLKVDLPLAEVYANVSFPPPPPEPVDDRAAPPPSGD